MNKRLLLAKCENLLHAVAQLEDDIDFGPGSDAKIEKIKREVDKFIEHIDKIREKVKSK